MTSALDEIAQKVAAGGRLTDEEVRAIDATHDIITVGMLADEVRRARHGKLTTFVRVAEIAAAAGPETLAAIPRAAGELRITGAPERLDEAASAVSRVAAAAGGRPVSGFALPELLACAAREGRPLEDVLAALRDVGLELVAEALDDALDDPIRALQAVDRARLRVARVTVRSAGGDRIALLRRVAAAQAAVGSLRAFAPLARGGSAIHPTTGYEDVKQVALARLLVDNIPSIQVDWARHGPKLAQVALTFGADDVDAVSPGDEAPDGWRRAPLEEIRRHIQAASFVPVERNGRFEIVSS
jgi:aminodeoxyfutalosine synthase